MENETWMCECGYSSETEFCPQCGKRKPETPEEEIARLKAEIETLKEALEEEKSNKRTVKDPETVADVNFRHVKKFEGNWFFLVMALIATVISVFSVAQLFTEISSGGKFLAMLPGIIVSLCALPVQIMAAVGFWKTWLAGVSKRGDANLARGPELVMSALSVLKVYVYILMIIALIGVAAGLVYGGIKYKGAAGLLEAIGITGTEGIAEIWLILAVIVACVAGVTLIVLFFNAAKKYIENIINRAELGKDYIYNTIFAAVLLCIIGLIGLGEGSIGFIAADIVNSTIKAVWADAGDILNISSSIQNTASGLLYVIAGVSAIFYNGVQKNIEKQIN